MRLASRRGAASPAAVATAAAAGILVVGALAAQGCASQEAAVRETIVRYNDTLADAYERPDPELMRRLVGARERERIAMYILFQLKQGKVLRTTLNRLRFVSIAIKDNRAVAKTQEDWTFQHLQKDTKRVLDKPRKIHYDATYGLLYTKGRWIVDRLMVKETPVK